MAKKKEEVNIPVEEVKEEVIEPEVAEPEVTEPEEVEPEGDVDAGVEEETQGSIDERILLKRIIVDNPSAPVFAIVRDTLDDSDPERWDSIIRRWIAKDYFIVIPPGADIRDGYLSDLGRLYAKVEYNL